MPLWKMKQSYRRDCLTSIRFTALQPSSHQGDNAIEQNLNKLFRREIRKRNVLVQCPHWRDRKTMPLKEFNKKYCLAT